jgi:hypothetical protein
MVDDAHWRVGETRSDVLIASRMSVFFSQLQTFLEPSVHGLAIVLLPSLCLDYSFPDGKKRPNG